MVLPAFTLEIDGGGVEEDKLKAGEEIPLPLEEALLDKVLGAAWRKGRCPFLFSQGISEKGHGAVGVMEGDYVHPVDGVVSPPLITRTVRAGDEEAMEDGKKDRPFDVKLELATCKQPLDNGWQAKLIPQTFKDQGRADLYGLGGGINLSRQDKKRSLGESRQRTDKGLDSAFGLQLIKASDGSDDPLGDFAAGFGVFNDLQVLVAARLLGSSEHGCLLC